MSLYTKTNPVGIDINIQSLQARLYNILNIASHEAYGRAEIYSENPYVYLTEREYKEVKIDDKFSLISFFTVNGEIERDEEANNYTANLSYVIFANIGVLKNTVTHRGDEEMIQDIVNILEKGLYKTQFINFHRGLKAIESLFSTKDVILSNTQPFNVTRFNLTVNYSYSNC